MSAHQVNLIGQLFLAGAVAVGVLQILLVWALLRRAGRRPTGGVLAPSPDMAVDVLENEVDQLRGELQRMRNERDWLRKECARLARGLNEPGH